MKQCILIIGGKERMNSFRGDSLKKINFELYLIRNSFKSKSNKKTFLPKLLHSTRLKFKKIPLENLLLDIILIKNVFFFSGKIRMYVCVSE